MLTVDYGLLDLRPGMTVLDLGCGEGRHAFEAYRRGAHVVALDHGVPEVVGDDAGLRVRAGDVGELTAALQLVLDSPSFADQLGRAGRRRVLASYTWRSTAERTAEWYREVLHRTGSPC